MDKQHYKRLVDMFHAAPVNQGIFLNPEMIVEQGKAIYKLKVTERYFHAANAMHGAIYFKLLDDAAYFAAASLEPEFFLLTKSYNIHFRRPVELDELTAEGEVIERSEAGTVARSRIRNLAGKIVAQGEGIFVKSQKPWREQLGYANAL